MSKAEAYPSKAPKKHFTLKQALDLTLKYQSGMERPARNQYSSLSQHSFVNYGRKSLRQARVFVPIKPLQPGLLFLSWVKGYAWDALFKCSTLGQPRGDTHKHQAKRYRKYQTRVDVSDNSKHISLLCLSCNYCNNKFYQHNCQTKGIINIRLGCKCLSVASLSCHYYHKITQIVQDQDLRNIRLGWKCVTAPNTLAYHASVVIYSLIRFYCSGSCRP